ncbi:MAG: protein serine/threonine phosphatase, partial [bacterium]
KDRTMLLLVVSIVVALVGIFLYISRLQSNLIETMALQGTSLYCDMLQEVRGAYTSEVVVRAQVGGTEVSHDYSTKEGAIPLPATFSMLVGKRVGERGDGSSTRLYSDFPFPWRKAEGGPKDDFEREALQYLKQNPTKSYYRIGEFQGRLSLRYARADLMRFACIKCHNTHPSSPKTDWNVGDVRGVLEVVRPLDVAVIKSKSNLRETAGLLGVIGISGLLLLGVTISKLRGSSEALKK